ncbi:MAG: polyprotein [Fushun monolepta lauta Solinvi-like virus 1]|nr:MAG: polyprotein [Fushun monolepta lauta Solinvi-like virus 1]
MRDCLKRFYSTFIGIYSALVGTSKQQNSTSNGIENSTSIGNYNSTSNGTFVHRKPKHIFNGSGIHTRLMMYTFIMTTMAMKRTMKYRQIPSSIGLFDHRITPISTIALQMYNIRWKTLPPWKPFKKIRKLRKQSESLIDTLKDYFISNRVDLALSVILATSIVQMVSTIVEMFRYKNAKQQITSFLKTNLILSVTNLAMSILGLVSIESEETVKAVINNLCETPEYTTFDNFIVDVKARKFIGHDLEKLIREARKNDEDFVVPRSPLSMKVLQKRNDKWEFNRSQALLHIRSIMQWKNEEDYYAFILFHDQGMDELSVKYFNKLIENVVVTMHITPKGTAPESFREDMTPTEWRIELFNTAMTSPCIPSTPHVQKFFRKFPILKSNMVTLENAIQSMDFSLVSLDEWEYVPDWIHCYLLCESNGWLEKNVSQLTNEDKRNLQKMKDEYYFSARNKKPDFYWPPETPIINAIVDIVKLDLTIEEGTVKEEIVKVYHAVESRVDQFVLNYLPVKNVVDIDHLDPEQMLYIESQLSTLLTRIAIGPREVIEYNDKIRIIQQVISFYRYLRAQKLRQMEFHPPMVKQFFESISPGLQKLGAWLIVILLSISHKILPKFGLEFDASKFAANYMSFSKLRTEATKSFTEIAELFGMETDKSKYQKKCADMIELLNSFLAKPAYYYASDVSKISDFKAATETAEAILAEAITPEFKAISQVMNGVYTSANKKRLEITSSTLLSTARFEPIVYCFQGLAGVGKTQLALELAKQLGEKLFPHVPSETRIIHVTSVDKYWPRLNGQPIAFFDESASTADLERCLLWRNIRALASPASFNCEAAAVDLKMQPCPFKVIITTTNTQLKELTRLIAEYNGNDAIVPAFSRVRVYSCSRTEAYGPVDLNDRNSIRYDSTGKFRHLTLHRMKIDSQESRQFVADQLSTSFDQLLTEALAWYDIKEIEHAALLRKNFYAKEKQSKTARLHLSVCIFGLPGGGKSTLVEKILPDLSVATTLPIVNLSEDTIIPKHKCIFVVDDYLPVQADPIREKQFMDLYNNQMENNSIIIACTNKIPWRIPTGVTFTVLEGFTIPVPYIKWQQYLPTYEPGLIRRYGWQGDFLFSDTNLGNLNILCDNRTYYQNVQQQLTLYDYLKFAIPLLTGIFTCFYSLILGFSLIILAVYFSSQQKLKQIQVGAMSSLVYKNYASLISNGADIGVKIQSVPDRPNAMINFYAESIKNIKIPADVISLQPHIFGSVETFDKAVVPWKIRIDSNILSVVLPNMSKFLVSQQVKTREDVLRMIKSYVNMLQSLNVNDIVISVVIRDLGKFLYEQGVLYMDVRQTQNNTVITPQWQAIVITNENADVLRRYDYDSFFNAKFKNIPLANITKDDLETARIIQEAVRDQKIETDPAYIHNLNKWNKKETKTVLTVEALKLKDKFTEFSGTMVGKVFLSLVGVLALFFVTKGVFGLFGSNETALQKGRKEFIAKFHGKLSKNGQRPSDLLLIDPEFEICSECSNNNWNSCVHICEKHPERQWVCYNCENKVNWTATPISCEYSCSWQYFMMHVLVYYNVCDDDYDKYFTDFCRMCQGEQTSQRVVKLRKRAPGTKRVKKVTTDDDCKHQGKWDDSSSDESDFGIQKKRQPGNKRSPRDYSTDFDNRKNEKEKKRTPGQPKTVKDYDTDYENRKKQSVLALPDMNAWSMFDSTQDVISRSHKNLAMLCMFPKGMYEADSILKINPSTVSGFLSVYALFVAENYFVTVNHALQNNYNIFVAEDFGVADNVITLYPVKVHQRNALKDVAFCSCTMPKSFKNITSNFISRKHIEDLASRKHETAFARYAKNKQLETSLGVGEFFIRKTDISYFDGSVEEAKDFAEITFGNSKTPRSTAGDCGLPHYLVTKGLDYSNKILGIHFAGTTGHGTSQMNSSLIFKEELEEWIEGLSKKKNSNEPVECPGCKVVKSGDLVSLPLPEKEVCENHTIRWDEDHDNSFTCFSRHLTFLKDTFSGSCEMNHGEHVPHSVHHPHTHCMPFYFKPEYEKYAQNSSRWVKHPTGEYSYWIYAQTTATISAIQNKYLKLHSTKQILRSSPTRNKKTGEIQKMRREYFLIAYPDSKGNYGMELKEPQIGMKDRTLYVKQQKVVVPPCVENIEILEEPIQNIDNGIPWDIPFQEGGKVSMIGSFRYNQSHTPKNDYKRIGLSTNLPIEKVPFCDDSEKAPPDQYEKLITDNFGKKSARATQSIQWDGDFRDVPAALRTHVTEQVAYGMHEVYAGLRVLSDHEVLHGTGDGGLERLNLDKSIGWTMSSLYEVKKKSDVLSVDNLGKVSWVDTPAGRFAKQFYQEGVELIKNGIRPWSVFLEMMKMEKLKLAKQYIGRIFCSEDIHGVLWGRKFMGDFVRRATLYDDGIGVGVDSNADFDRIYHKLVEKGLYWTGDYSRWDKTVPLWLYRIACDVLIKLNPHLEKEIRTIVDMSSKTIHVSGRSMFYVSGGMPSGSFWTAPMNSFINRCLIYTVYCVLFAEKFGCFPDWQDFITNVYVMAYGDDIVVAVTPERNFFTQEAAARIINRLGLVMSPADKDGNLVDFEPMNKLSWISRYFRQLGNYPVIVGALKKISINAWLHWTKHETAIQIGSQYTSALYEASLWEKDYFEQIYADVKLGIKEFPQVKNYVVLQPYEAYHDDIFHNSAIAALFRQLSTLCQESDFNTSVNIIRSGALDNRLNIILKAINSEKQSVNEFKMTAQPVYRNQNLDAKQLENLAEKSFISLLNEAWQAGHITKPLYDFWQSGTATWNCLASAAKTGWCQSVKSSNATGVSKQSSKEGAAEKLWYLLFPEDKAGTFRQSLLSQRAVRFASVAGTLTTAQAMTFDERHESLIEQFWYLVPLIYLLYLVIRKTIKYVSIGNGEIKYDQELPVHYMSQKEFNRRLRRSHYLRKQLAQAIAKVQQHNRQSDLRKQAGDMNVSGLQLATPAPSGVDVNTTTGTSIFTNRMIGNTRLTLNNTTSVINNPGAAGAPYDYLTKIHGIYSLHLSGTLSSTTASGAEVFRVSLDPATWPEELQTYVNMHESICPDIDISVMINGAAGALGTMKIGWVPDADAKNKYSLADLQSIASTDVTFNQTSVFEIGISDLRRANQYRKTVGDGEPFPGVVALISLPVGNVQKTGTIEFGWQVYMKLGANCFFMNPKSVTTTKVNEKINLDEHITDEIIDFLVGSDGIAATATDQTYDTGVTALKNAIPIGSIMENGYYVDGSLSADEISNLKQEDFTWYYQDPSDSNKVLTKSYHTKPKAIRSYLLYAFGVIPDIMLPANQVIDLQGILCNIASIDLGFSQPITQCVLYEHGYILLQPVGTPTITTSGLNVRVVDYEKDPIYYGWVANLTNVSQTTVCGYKENACCLPYGFELSELPVQLASNEFLNNFDARKQNVQHNWLQGTGYVENGFKYCSQKSTDNSFQPWVPNSSDTLEDIKIPFKVEDGYVFAPSAVSSNGSTITTSTGLTEFFFAKPGFSLTNKINSYIPPLASGVVTLLKRLMNLANGRIMNFTIFIQDMPDFQVTLNGELILIKPTEVCMAKRGVRVSETYLSNFTFTSNIETLQTFNTTQIPWTTIVATSQSKTFKSRKMKQSGAFWGMAAGSMMSGLGGGMSAYFANQQDQQNLREIMDTNNKFKKQYLAQQFDQQLALQTQQQNFQRGNIGLSNGGAVGNMMRGNTASASVGPQQQFVQSGKLDYLADSGARAPRKPTVNSQNIGSTKIRVPELDTKDRQLGDNMYDDLLHNLSLNADETPSTLAGTQKGIYLNLHNNLMADGIPGKSDEEKQALVKLSTQDIKRNTDPLLNKKNKQGQTPMDKASGAASHIAPAIGQVNDEIMGGMADHAYNVLGLSRYENDNSPTMSASPHPNIDFENTYSPADIHNYL